MEVRMMSVKLAIALLISVCLVKIMMEWFQIIIDGPYPPTVVSIKKLLIKTVLVIASVLISLLVGYIQPTFNKHMNGHESTCEEKRKEICVTDKMQSISLDSLNKAEEVSTYADIELDGTESQEKSDGISVMAAPDLLGMYEQAAINICMQRGYKYKLEFYLGGDGTVVSQHPTAVNSMGIGDDIALNVGVPENEFSDKLLVLINKRRRILGLGELFFSDQLNMACTILAQENVDSGESAGSDDSQWLSVISEKNISLRDGSYMSICNISSLSDVNERIWQNKDREGSRLLTQSFSKIGMAYTDNNTLIIIVGD